MRETKYPKVAFFRATDEQHAAFKRHSLADYLRSCIDRYIKRIEQGKKK